jgi:hypothetical protein
VSEAVEAANLAAGAVTASKTALAAINSTTGTLNAGTVSSTQLVANAVQAVNIANNAVTASKTAIAAINRSTGFLNASTVGTAQLVANAVEDVKIANGAVTAAKTSLAAIDNFTGLLNPGTVNTTQLVAEAVQAVNLANGAVTASKVSLAAIDSASGGLTANSVGASQITSGAVQSDKLAAMSVTASKLNVTLGGGNLLRNSGFDFGNADHWYGADPSTTLATYRIMYKGFSLRCQATSSGDRYVWQTSACKPNTRYTLSAWLWVEALDPSALFGRSVLLYDQVGTSNSDYSLVYGIEGSRWHRVSTSITTGPNASVIESRLYIPFGVVYWDCAQLEEGDYPTAYAPMPQELIPGSIDTGLLANSAITDVKIAAGAVNSSKLSIRKHLIY